MVMKCLICGRETVYQGNPFRPFCSERCKLIDLDNWLAGRYRIPISSENRESKSSAPVPVDDEAGDRD
jgi:endogenous inhibitor of DNA gyrase (YacG/DUF329 family)